MVRLRAIVSCDAVGQIVEQGPSERVLGDPRMTIPGNCGGDYIRRCRLTERLGE
jgi:hypothetical protein